MASREAAKYSFLIYIFFRCIEMMWRMMKDQSDLENCTFSTLTSSPDDGHETKSILRVALGHGQKLGETCSGLQLLG